MGWKNNLLTAAGITLFSLASAGVGYGVSDFKIIPGYYSKEEISSIHKTGALTGGLIGFCGLSICALGFYYEDKKSRGDFIKNVPYNSRLTAWGQLQQQEDAEAERLREDGESQERSSVSDERSNVSDDEDWE